MMIKVWKKSRQHLITFSAFVCNFKWCALLNTFYSKKWNSISIQSKYLDEFHVYSTNKDQHDEREKITKTISFWWKKNEGHLNLWKGMTKQTTNERKYVEKNDFIWITVEIKLSRGKKNRTSPQPLRHLNFIRISA